jgi:signal transduction histidine kinase
MNGFLIASVSLAYLALLFALAYRVENGRPLSGFLGRQDVVYALSIAVYCTAWTFYGSIGRAATSGPDFLAIYLGPVLTVPFWWIVLRKIIRISREQSVASLADFIAARYGKDPVLGGFIALACLISIVPYLALQLKAISESFGHLSVGFETQQSQSMAWHTTGWFNSLAITSVLALFVIWFSTGSLQANKPKEGLVYAIAVESLVKLIAFLAVAIYIVWGCFNGPSAIFSSASTLPQFEALTRLDVNGSYADWFWLLLVSGFAIFLLPRQFQVSVVENKKESHILTAMWMFPLYLFLINLFVAPVAMAGLLQFEGSPILPDQYLLAFPSLNEQNILGLVTFLGGFSAATAMIIVTTTALSLMLSNNVLLPFVIRGAHTFSGAYDANLTGVLISTRRLSIILILLSAYFYATFFTHDAPLVSIGITSFIAVSQFAPAFFGGLYWKNGNRYGAFAGIASGLLIWFYMLIWPVIQLKIGVWSGISAYTLLTPGINPIVSIAGFNATSNVIFWSLSFNVSLYIFVSLATKPSTLETSQAEAYVGVFRQSQYFENSPAWKVTARFPDVKSLLIKFIGNRRTEEVLDRYARRNNLDWNTRPDMDSRAIAFAERLLAETIGPASARILLSSVVKDAQIGIGEVVDILKESQETIELNKALKVQSEQLSKATLALTSANEKLKRYAEQKDEFLYTVTHELRSPLTSIKAMAEMLHDMPDLSDEERSRFTTTIINECERLTRLISQVLDLERFESGGMDLHYAEVHPVELLKESIQTFATTMEQKGITLRLYTPTTVSPFFADHDKLLQVLINLLSNAVKFAPADEGQVACTVLDNDDQVQFMVADNGPGIKTEEQPYVFDKFYQAKNQTRKKPHGSGLGLAISKSIVERHNGSIWVESAPSHGATFLFTVPRFQPTPKQAE